MERLGTGIDTFMGVVVGESSHLEIQQCSQNGREGDLSIYFRDYALFQASGTRILLHQRLLRSRDLRSQSPSLSLSLLLTGCTGLLTLVSHSLILSRLFLPVDLDVFLLFGPMIYELGHGLTLLHLHLDVTPRSLIQAFSHLLPHNLP